jgi:VIT1/CCC1 family predicted Fe2+/Mn2+ transporter
VVFSEELEKTKSSEEEVVARAKELAHDLEVARAEIERVTTAAAAAAALAEREAQIKLQTLQSVLDKAIGEVSDYKSLLARLTPLRDSAT